MPSKTSASASPGALRSDDTVLGTMWARGGSSGSFRSSSGGVTAAGSFVRSLVDQEDGRDGTLSRWTEAQTVHLRKELISKHEASLRRLRAELQERFEEQIQFERARLTEAHEQALEQQRVALLKLHDDRIERRYVAMVHESEEELWGEYESRLALQKSEFQRTLREECGTVRAEVTAASQLKLQEKDEHWRHLMELRESEHVEALAHVRHQMEIKHAEDLAVQRDVCRREFSAQHDELVAELRRTRSRLEPEEISHLNTSASAAHGDVFYATLKSFDDRAHGFGH